MSNVMSSDGLDLIFRNGRTHNAWLDKPVEDALLRQVYDLAKMGPASANIVPNADRLREIPGGEGETQARTRCGQRGQDHEGSRHRHPRHGHPLF